MVSEEYIEDIYSGLRNSRFVLLFLGAGFSAPLGFRTAKQLAEMLANTLSKNPKDLEGKSLQEVVESLEKEGVDRGLIIEKIRSEYSSRKDSGGAANPYVKLKMLLDRLDARTIIFTTNWDREIDRVFGDGAEIVSSQDQLSKILGKNELPKITVFKLHGDIGAEDIKETLVLTKRDIEKSLGMRKKFYDKFKGVLAESRLLILGYSMGDSDILDIYREMRGDVLKEVDYLITVGLDPDAASKIHEEFPSLKIISQDILEFLERLNSYGKITVPPLTMPLKVDKDIEDIIVGGGNIIVVGPRLCGKTYTSLRLQSHFGDYYILDIPYYSSEAKDYQIILNALEHGPNIKVAIFIPDYYLDYYSEKYEREKGKKMFDSRDFKKIYHTVDRDDAEEIFINLIDPGLRSTVRKRPSIIETALKISEYSESKGPLKIRDRTYYLLGLLRAQAIRIQGDGELYRIISDKNREHTADEIKKLEEEEQKELERLEQEIVRENKHFEGLYISMGVIAPLALREVSEAIEGGSYGVFEVLSRHGLSGVLASVLPMLGWVPIGALGIGLIFALYEWHKNRGEGNSVFSYLVRAKEHWANLSREAKEVVAYDFEKKNKLKPGEGYEFLDGLLGSNKIGSLENEIKKFLDQNPEFFEKQIQNSEAWRNLESQLKTFNKSVDDLAKDFWDSIEEIHKEIEQINKNIEEINKKIEEIKNEIKNLRQGLYSIIGVAKISNESDLRKQLNLAVPEFLVGLESSEADGQVMSLANKIIEKSSNKVVILDGEPGAGKSTLLYIIGKRLLEQNKELYFIQNPHFNSTAFNSLGPDTYAIMDVQAHHDGNIILHNIANVGGNVQLSRIIIAIRTGFVNQNRAKISEAGYIEEYQLKLQDNILLEIAKRGLQGMNNNLTSNLTQDELSSLASKLAGKSEHVPLYISEAIKKLSIDIRNKGVLTLEMVEEMIEALPEGIGAMILANLNSEAERSKLILVSYYLVSHYTKFPKEFLSTLENMFNIPKPLFVNELAEQNSVTLHSWYRDMTDLIFSEKYDELKKYKSPNESPKEVENKVENIKNAMNAIISGNFFVERGIRCLKNVFDTLEKNEALKSLWEPIKKFNDNLDLGGRVPYEYLIDALMLCLIISTSAHYLIKEESKKYKYGFNIDKESVSFDKLDSGSRQFYYNLMDFLFNTYLNEDILNEVESGSRPFYALTILYISRFLTYHPIAKEISDGLLRDSNKKNEFIDIYEKYASQFNLLAISYNNPIIKKYIIALFPFYSGITDLKCSDPHYHELKANIFESMGKLDEAIAEMDIAIKLDPNNPLYHEEKADILARRGKLDEAIAEWDNAIELDPDNPLYHEKKAAFLTRRGKLDEAIAEMDIAIKLDPNNPWHYHRKAYFLARRGKLDEAIAEMDIAIELDPNNPLYHEWKALFLARRRKHYEAIAEWDIVIELNPDNPKYREWKAYFLASRGKLDEAIAEWDILIELDPDNPWHREWKADILARRRKDDEAIAEMDIAIELDPNNPWHHHRKADIFERTGKLDEAIAEMDIAIKLDPNNPLYHEEKALFLASRGKLDEAIAEMDIAIKLDPNNPKYREWKADILARRGKLDEAIAEWDNAIKLDPNNPLYHEEKALFLASRGKLDEAIAEMDIAIKLEPNNPWHHYNKGVILKIFGRVEEAIKSVEEALNVSPSNIRILILYLELKAGLDQSMSVFKKIIELIILDVIDKEQFCAEIDKELKKEDLNEKEKDALLNVKDMICGSEGNYKNG